jgi:hypothetical protein
MAISLDLSQKSELRLLAALVREVARAAEGGPFFLAGAYARDVLLFHAHGIDTGRQTADVDLAIAVESWQRYDALRAALIARGFTADSTGASAPTSQRGARGFLPACFGRQGKTTPGARASGGQHRPREIRGPARPLPGTARPAATRRVALPDYAAPLTRRRSATHHPYRV